MLPRKMFKFRVSEMLFPAFFCSDLIRRKMQLVSYCLLYLAISRVVGKVHSSRKKASDTLRIVE